MVVVIVDDDWAMLELITLFLKRKGYDVRAFSDSLECWEWIADESNTCPDLLITDFMMPYYDGGELVSKIRTESRCRDVPILLISSLDTAPNRDDLWDLFLRKSFSREQLYEAMEKTIERGKSRNNR